MTCKPHQRAVALDGAWHRAKIAGELDVQLPIHPFNVPHDLRRT